LTPATHWPLSRYGLAARHLGQMQGGYATGCPIATTQDDRRNRGSRSRHLNLRLAPGHGPAARYAADVMSSIR
jgi:hypothetical protein